MGSSPFLSIVPEVGEGGEPGASSSVKPLVGCRRDGTGRGGEADECLKAGTSLRLLCPAGASSSWSKRSRRCSSSGAGSTPRWPRRRSGSASKRPGEWAGSGAPAVAKGWRQPEAWEQWGWFPQARLWWEEGWCSRWAKKASSLTRLGWRRCWEVPFVCGQAESGGGGAAAAAGGEQLGRHQGAEGGVRKGEGGAGEAASGLVFPSSLGPGLLFLGARSLVPSV